MSQHYYQTQYQGREVTVLMGWDRPLQGFFMVIEYSDTNDEYLYSNLKDADLKRYIGLPPTLDHFIEKLTALELKVPREMIDGVREDRVHNVGNFLRWHSAPADVLVG